MKTLRLCLLISAFCLVSVTKATASDFKVDGINYNITSSTDLTVEVTFEPGSYTNKLPYTEELTIPEYVTYRGKTYTVTSIGKKAFNDFAFSGSITIPASVTSIGDMAFSSCYNLTSITIPENSALTSIGEGAFYGCYRLTNSITLPASLTSIGNNAFRNCTDLTSITIPENSALTSIGDSTFYNCASIAYINIPEGVASIGDGAFYGCYHLTNSITLPASLTSIGDDAFRGCTSLTSITIPENSALTSIGDRAFSYCENLTFSIPENIALISIGEYAFYKCHLTNSITIPESMTSIGDGTYYGCDLTSITIPESVTSIGNEAFSFCEGLTSITIPASVTSIGDMAFSRCYNLTSITIPENSALTSIGDNAFSNCTGLTSITIPASVTSIGDNAFCNCTGLASITIPASVTSIGDGAFSGCSSLTEITIQSVIPPTFGVDVFIGINAKAVLNYPKGSDYSVLKRYFSNFGAEHMNGNSWIVEDDGTAYVYPNGSYTLSGYSGSKTIKKVYAYGFNDIGVLNSPLLEEFYAFPLPGSPIILESVGWGAFNNCFSLRTVSLQNGLTSSDGFAFAGCRNLKYIYLPVGLTYIGEAAFANTGIEFLVVPESVMYIGDFNNPANWVFMNPYGQTVMERLPDDLDGAYIPEGAVGYDNYKFPKEHNGYIVSDDKIFVFGNWGGNISENIKKVEMTPDMHGQLGEIRTLPSTVTFDILPGVTNNPDQIYTIEGSNAVFIGDELVAGRANSIIPKGTKRIGDRAFENSGLTSIEIPASVTSIGYGAFSYCYGLTSITIPESVTSIGEDAFLDCRSLTSLEIPNSVTFIGRKAFGGCVGVDTIIVDEANPVYDSRDSCNAIIETQSNKLIFASKTVTIPSSVTSIGGYAFFLLEDMDITIPSTVTSFDNYAFYNTKNLYLESLTPPTIETEDGLIFGWGVIIVPSDAYESYCNADVWRYYKDIILTKEMAEYEIEASSTEGMSGVLNEVGVDEADRVVKLKVKGKINSYDITVMRDKMPNLQELDLSEATVVASKRPFYQTYCTGKNSLGSYAFYDLDNLVSVKLPKGLTSIGDCAFMGCDKLKSVDASLTEGLYMGEKTFYGCSNLQEFVAPQVISYIGSGSFVDWTAFATRPPRPCLSDVT